MIMDNKAVDKISIALCTRNGEAYLEQQLQSIGAQSLLPDELVICDDASTDSTVKLIKHFASTSSFSINLIQNQEQLGVVKNFSKALSCCRGDYLALCDQDNIWLPEKLKTDFDLIRKTETTLGKSFPLLVHSDLKNIDHSGLLRSSSFMKLRHIKHVSKDPLRRLLAQNFVTGCTVMVNRPLIELALPIPHTAVMHDWWLALVAAACGKIIFNENTAILFRQHQNNVIGARSFFSANSLSRLTNFPALEKELAATLIQAGELAARLKKLPAFSCPPYLEEYLASARWGGINTASLARREAIGKAGRLRNLIFLLILIKKGYLRQVAQKSNHW